MGGRSYLGWLVDVWTIRPESDNGLGIVYHYHVYQYCSLRLLVLTKGYTLQSQLMYRALRGLVVSHDTYGDMFLFCTAQEPDKTSLARVESRLKDPVLDVMMPRKHVACNFPFRHRHSFCLFSPLIQIS